MHLPAGGPGTGACVPEPEGAAASPNSWRPEGSPGTTVSDPVAALERRTPTEGLPATALLRAPSLPRGRPVCEQSACPPWRWERQDILSSAWGVLRYPGDGVAAGFGGRSASVLSRRPAQGLGWRGHYSLLSWRPAWEGRGGWGPLLVLVQAVLTQASVGEARPKPLPRAEAWGRVKDQLNPAAEERPGWRHFWGLAQPAGGCRQAGRLTHSGKQ